MLTLEALKELGADADDGMKRCLNNEGLYLRLVNMAIDDGGYEALRAAIEKKDLNEGFERAHALKGMLGNVSLTNLLKPILTMTEALRAREDIDYTPYLEEMEEELRKLRELK